MPFLSGLHGFLWQISCHFPLAILEIFFLCLQFLEIKYHKSLGGFFWSFPIWDSYSLLKRWASCQICEVSNHYFSWVLEPFILSRTVMAQVINICYCPTGFWCSLPFPCSLSSIYCLLFRLGNFSCFVFQVTDFFFFLVCSILMLSPFTELFISLIVVFSSKMFILLFLYVFYFFADALFCPLFQACLYCSSIKAILWWYL